MTSAQQAVAKLFGAIVPIALVVASIVFAAPAAADNGVITKPSKNSVADTVAYFEKAVKEKAKMGFVFFTTIDHAAAAKQAGLAMRPRMLMVFGNPRIGTPVMVKTPLLAIDVPLKALVWEDDEGKVWLSYNSAEYLYKTIFARHGAEAPEVEPLAKLLDLVSDQATQ
jgi:uncharacterized protein (DUF302 family)